METLLKQVREKFTGAEEENKADLGGSRDQRIPTQKTQSFKEKKKAQNWFQRQFSRKMSHDYDSKEMEHASAVAAAALAITSQELSEIPQKKKSAFPEISLNKTRSKGDDTKFPISPPGSASKRFPGSFKSTDDQGNMVPATDAKKPDEAITPAPSIKKTPTFGEPFKNTEDNRPPAPKVPPPVQPVSLRPPPPPPPVMQTTTRPSPAEIKADAWERNELQKIKDRYEKLKETIDSWENRKKMKARRKLNKEEQSELERKRVKAMKKYQSKMKYIEEIAGGARAQAAERRRNEELKAKEKANIIRTTGKLPGACPCF